MSVLEDSTVSRIVMHFNKGHLLDPIIPMWTVKHKGNTYYVHHLESTIGFHTKETPDNEVTKGSIQFKGKLRIVEDESGKTAYVEG